MNYRTYLTQATDVQNFRVRFGDLARNARGWMDLSFDIKRLPELIVTDKEAAVEMAVSMLRGYYKKERESMSLEKRIRRYKKYRRKMRQQDYYDDDVKEYGLYDFDSEELFPVIHGGDWGRIKAALLHGRGYKTEVAMPNNRTKTFDETGLMFHSEFPDRARYYAKDSAAQRVGIQAILVAMVPKKYLYHNQGDEYCLPTWHYDKIASWNIFVEWEDGFWDIENYYLSVYCNQRILKRTRELLNI